MQRQSTNAALARAIEHYGAGRRDQAEMLCRRVLDTDPDHIQALNLAAAIAFVSNKAAEGAALLHRVFALEPDNARAFITLGDALATQGQLQGAADAFHRAIALRSNDSELQIKLGTALLDLNRIGEAEAAYRRAVALSPTIRARFHLALVLAAQNRLTEAADSYRAIIGDDPGLLEARINLANVLMDLGDLDEAIATYRAAIATDPAFAAGHRNLALVLRRQKHYDAALQAARQAMTLDPHDANNALVLGDVLLDLERADEAIALYREAIVRHPATPALHCNLGLALHRRAQQEEIAQRSGKSTADARQKVDWLDDALTAYLRAAELAPQDPGILTNLAACYCDLRQYDNALAACDRATQAKPDHAPAHTNRGMVLEATGDIQGAIAAHRDAIAADPSYAKGYTNLSVTLRSAGLLDEALIHSARAVALCPDEPLIHYNHAHYLLMNGKFTDGFREFEWRHRSSELRDGEEFIGRPQWSGDFLAGRTLMLHSEFGLGDALQFVRYIPAAVAMGGKVMLQVQPALVSLLRGSLEIPVIPRGEALPDFDVQLPLMSLPRVFNTTVETIPASVPYLRTDAAKVMRWRQALGHEQALKVGVTWAGNPRHKGDSQRSLSAQAVLPRLLMPGVQLYSLQKDHKPEDADVLTSLGDRVIDLAPALGDFSDTAAAVAALDLVIAVDSSVAHLAGALGCPVWVMLPYALDWRWLRDREDCPWYPTMRLFRQKRQRDWESVLVRLPEQLRQVCAGDPDALVPGGSRSLAQAG